MNTLNINNFQPYKAALYARVSTARQEKEETVESQLKEIEERVEKEQHELALRFVDEGWSGGILARPQLDELRDAAKRKEFQILYVYDLGRLSRDFTDQLILMRELEEAGIEVISLHDINAKTDEDTLARGVMGLFHDFERKKIAERMRRGKLHKAKSGFLINAQSLYGYNYIKKTDNTPAGYEVNEEQADVVRNIFDWVGNERISLREVIRRLYDKGIPPRKGKSEFWTKGPVVRMLRCESYLKGKVYYNKSESVVGNRRKNEEKYNKIKKNSRRVRSKEEWLPFKVNPILHDKFLFDKVQKILEFNQKYARKNRKYDYLLSGLVYCGCGNKRAGDGCSKNGHYYYRCTERITKIPSERKCQAQGVNAQCLDMDLWQNLIKIFKDQDILRQYVATWLKTESQKDTGKIQARAKVMDAIEKIGEEEKRYAKAYGTGDLEFEQFQELIKEAKKRKIVWQNQLNDLAKISEDRVDEFELDDICHEATLVLQSLDLSNKTQIIRDIIDKVVVNTTERTVDVWGHIALQNQILAERLGHEPTSRNSWFA